MEKKYKTLKDFFPFYLEEHSHPFNRALHFVGSSLALGCILGFLSTGKFYILAFALVSGYFFAWIGHFFVEKNRPATFTYPFYSFISDWIMYFKMLTGRIDVEFAKIKSNNS
ncbi:DUF962 domain-containing protein [Leptospira sp. 85282-16]|uniref:DUF962 domain-containing protein n=1 Tax=Leptospira montravelensis TaxID=2484961 RepID=A0ABY2LTM8_9LEPT|nr:MULTISPECIES: DUF962 domain-containing protein [Leptospira]MCT8334439.1 DUF962 domain-containing protein [Leptospira sp. 85282-16]TGK80798.1 DUF962 domain-containing protein [Leptospira montravelensis]TGL01610.1 DUF962 domain-containing protein [Leptospira montravelensis]